MTPIEISSAKSETVVPPRARRCFSLLVVALIGLFASTAPLLAEEIETRKESDCPPVLSDEIKHLIDGMLEIYQSHTLLLDQIWIEKTLGVTFVDRKDFTGIVTYRIEGLPFNSTGDYSLHSSYVLGKFGVGVKIWLDTSRVCAHLPQVMKYIGKPFKRHLVFFNPESESYFESRKPNWPGVEDSAHYSLIIQGESTSEIKPKLSMMIQGIECVSNIYVTTGLRQPD